MGSETIQAERPSFWDLYSPKLITVWREGYGFADFRADAMAGLTVAIVALPLSMAIAIASGAAPERGLYTAIVGGFFVSLLGGSRFQIGGPAGAFIGLVALTVARVGIEGLALATILSGLMLMAAGYLRLGTYIKFIPYPVTDRISRLALPSSSSLARFTTLLGLTPGAKEPAAFVPKIMALLPALPTTNVSAVTIAAGTILLISALKWLRPHWPGFIIAITVAAAAVALLHLSVETIGTRFGAIPNGLPAPHLPPISLNKIFAVLPDAFSFTLLGAIEIPAFGVCCRWYDGPPSSFQLRVGSTRCGKHCVGFVWRALRHRHHCTHRHQCTGRRP